MEGPLKVAFIDAIGETDYRLSEGANSDIQMKALLARLVLCTRLG
jgi:replication factor C small subunit